MKLKFPNLTKSQKRLVYGIAFSSIIIVSVVLFIPFSPTFIGGTSWGFDYQINKLIINGEVQEEALNGAPDETSHDPGGTYTFLPNVIPSFDVRTNYEWWEDIDGNPIYTGAEWSGLCPDIGVTVSLPWRVDANGVKVANNFEDPLAPAYQVGEEIHKLYYYAFDVMVKTKADEFTVPGTLQSLWQPWISSECGVMDVDTIVTVGMIKRYPDDVIGEFMDCKVLDVELSDIQLQSGLAWEVAPNRAPKQDINQGIPISNRDAQDTLYTCDLLFTTTLTNGLARSGDNLLPYDVWVRKTVQMSVLLKAPLRIGETGEPQDPFDPPAFTPPPDPFVMIIIILGIVLAIVICVVVFRALGVVGAIANVFGGAKNAKG